MREEFPDISFEDKYAEEARLNPELRRAIRLMEQAAKAHKGKDIEKAIELYRESIAFYPTADAHTYLGWMYSFQERYEEAIEECHQAIETDDEFGNPYNDIGSYLIKLDEEDAALEWFQKAKTAPRYTPRHFPYMNLGRLYLKRKKYGKALGEFYRAVQLAPEEQVLRNQVRDLVGLLN
ncbi:MAG: tetratricopeptide repeat protein [bacterium]|nr:tetratricopeptide repeat protein [bacterium]